MLNLEIKRQLTSKPALIIMILLAIAFLIGRRVIDPTSVLTIERESTEITDADVTASEINELPAHSEEVIKQQKIAIKTLSTEMAQLKEGDEDGFKRVLKEKFGLEVKQFVKHADGTYSAELSGPEIKESKETPVFSKERAKVFESSLMSAFNNGKKVELSPRDQEELRKFNAFMSTNL